MEKNKDINFEIIEDIKLTSLSLGLKENEIKKLREKYGSNKIITKKKTPMWLKFLKQFVEPMIILLLIAVILSFGIAIYGSVTGTFKNDLIELIIAYVEPCVILLIVLLNAIFGLLQENKAEKSIDALANLTAPQARVFRNGEEIIINSDEVVVGDILLIEAGSQISADGILIESAKLEIEEAVLTGESLPVSKQEVKTIAWDQIENSDYKVFSGTSVVNGRAKVLVTSVGMKTEIGKIAKMINDEGDVLTPLQKKLAKLSKIIGIIAAFLCVITLFVYIYVVAQGNWSQWNHAILISITLAIGTIPEGLVPIVTVILSSGVKRLSQKSALVKKLPAAETLGNVSIICSDKTGTLTQNKMTVTNIFSQNISERDLITKAILCTDASMSYDEEGKIQYLGDPTETSILMAGMNFQEKIIKNEINNQFKRVAEFPFDSDRKLMSVIVENNGKYQVITKGAPDSVFKIINNYDEKFNDKNLEYADQALRVLAISTKEIDFIPTQDQIKEIESNQTFIGLIGMIDPPREEAKESVKLAQQAGIKVVMITGDHANTAKAIATQLGIFDSSTDKVLTGAQLQAMSEEDLRNNIFKFSVYARVSPEDKIRIVKAWQSHDKVVSMTGDGVNDAPALKAADLGCAMGITGTDVSKQAADMILTDDNFSTIIEAVKEGRGILYSIQRLMIFLLITNLSALLVTFVGMLIFKTNPLSSLQILWINVISETFPGIALGLNRGAKNLMTNKPRSKDEFILNKAMMIKIVILGIFISSLTLFAFWLGTYSYDLNTWDMSKEAQHLGSGIAFMSMGLMLSMNSIILRSDEILFKQKWEETKFVVFAFLVSFIVLLPVVYIPGLSDVFGMNVYRGKMLAINLLPFGLALLPMLFVEISKLFTNNKIKNTSK